MPGSAPYVDQTAVLEIRLEVIDPDSRRLRWNGDPMASERTTTALLECVDALRDAARGAGLDLVRTSYGVTADAR
jgi:hypothetical protein